MDIMEFDDYQNDDFYFIAGYTSGGAPYGLTWEEMGLKPYEAFKEPGDSEEPEYFEGLDDFEELPFC